MTLEISASKLCKARLCGKWAYPTGKAGGWRSPSSNTTKAILDGNLRHAVMEFYLKSVVMKNLLLDKEEVLEMLEDDKINALISFLEENPEKYPSELKIESQRMANRLANVVGQLSAALAQSFGKLVSAYSELKIGGKSIQLNPSFVLNHGEVDAIFVYENNGTRSIIIVDWKRNLGDGAEEYYTSQLFTYARCLVERPDLIDLHDITAEEIFVMLVEIGNNENLEFNRIIKRYNRKKLVGILDSALKNIETTEPQAGGHCSSRCLHAFNFKNPCRAFT
ncbi:MAG: PD-(D/E)XK nuclease family protein, partial [Candidatus Poseidoniaceae archaeon]